MSLERNICFCLFQANWERNILEEATGLVSSEGDATCSSTAVVQPEPVADQSASDNAMTSSDEPRHEDVDQPEDDDQLEDELDKLNLEDAVDDVADEDLDENELLKDD